MLAPGFESEALTVVDVLRRANITVMVGFKNMIGSHAIQKVRADPCL